MTTIYELETMATPGPWDLKGPIRNQTDDYECLSLIGSGMLLGELNDGIPRTSPVKNWKAEAEANAKLLVHCRNNFMKALEALKHTLVWAECGNTTRMTNLRTLIKELEEA